MLEIMEGFGDIHCHGEVNTYLLRIVPVYFDDTVQATGPTNTHREIFSYVFYEMI